MKFSDVRAKYPQYNDMSDGELATALHSKYYSDMDFNDFADKIGYDVFSYNEPSPKQKETDMWAKAHIPVTPKSMGNFAGGAVDAVLDWGSNIVNFPLTNEGETIEDLTGIDFKRPSMPTYDKDSIGATVGSVAAEVANPINWASRPIRAVGGATMYAPDDNITSMVSDDAKEFFTEGGLTGELAGRAVNAIEGVLGPELIRKGIEGVQALRGSRIVDNKKLTNIQNQLADPMNVDRFTDVDGNLTNYLRSDFETVQDVFKSLETMQGQSAKVGYQDVINLLGERGMSPAKAKSVLTEFGIKPSTFEKASEELRASSLGGPLETFGILSKGKQEPLKAAGSRQAMEDVGEFGEQVGRRKVTPTDTDEFFFDELDGLADQVEKTEYADIKFSQILDQEIDMAKRSALHIKNGEFTEAREVLGELEGYFTGRLKTIDDLKKDNLKKPAKDRLPPEEIQALEEERRLFKRAWEGDSETKGLKGIVDMMKDSSKLAEEASPKMTAGDFAGRVMSGGILGFLDPTGVPGGLPALAAVSKVASSKGIQGRANTKIAQQGELLRGAGIDDIYGTGLKTDLASQGGIGAIRSGEDSEESSTGTSNPLRSMLRDISYELRKKSITDEYDKI